jgi:hypothetical protein
MRPICLDIMEKIMFKKSVLAAALALALGHSQAATVFNNGAPDLVSATGMTEFVVADNFTVGATFDITNIRFWSAQDTASAYVGSVSWAIYSDAVGAPGVALTSGLATVPGTATGGTIGGGASIYLFDIPVVAFTLSAGSYWLTLLNGAAPNPAAPGFMGWATASPGTGPGGMYLDAGSWVSSGSEQAFRIDGNPPNPNPGIPEPGTVALLLAGLAVSGGLRQARRR